MKSFLCVFKLRLLYKHFFEMQLNYDHYYFKHLYVSLESNYIFAYVIFIHSLTSSVGIIWRLYASDYLYITRQSKAFIYSAKIKRGKNTNNSKSRQRFNSPINKAPTYIKLLQRENGTWCFFFPPSTIFSFIFHFFFRFYLFFFILYIHVSSSREKEAVSPSGSI